MALRDTVEAVLATMTIEEIEGTRDESGQVDDPSNIITPTEETVRAVLDAYAAGTDRGEIKRTIFQDGLKLSNKQIRRIIRFRKQYLDNLEEPPSKAANRAARRGN
jgi:hypothetical protein